MTCSCSGLIESAAGMFLWLIENQHPVYCQKSQLITTSVCECAVCEDCAFLIKSCRLALSVAAGFHLIYCFVFFLSSHERCRGAPAHPLCAVFQDWHILVACAHTQEEIFRGARTLIGSMSQDVNSVCPAHIYVTLAFYKTVQQHTHAHTDTHECTWRTVWAEKEQQRAVSCSFYVLSFLFFVNCIIVCAGVFVRLLFSACMYQTVQHTLLKHKSLLPCVCVCV